MSVTNHYNKSSQNKLFGMEIAIILCTGGSDEKLNEERDIR